MPRLIEIADREDPRIAPYRDIRERDLVGRRNRFVAEGRVVLDALIGASRFEIESVLLLENRFEGASALLGRLAANVPVYVGGRELLDQIVGFPMHRGILAIGVEPRLGDLQSLLARQQSRSTIVVLSGISNHDNIGGIFRNAAAFGADAVVLDETCSDPLYRKALRVSVGAVLKIPFVRAGSLDSIMDALAHSAFDLFATSPAAYRDIMEITPGDRRAVVFGSEGNGLPPAAIARMTPVKIAMAPGFDSLNVAAASAIILHHLSRPRTR